MHPTGTWRIGGIADHWSKLELGWHVSTTANHRDAIETVEHAIVETERLLGRPLRELLTDQETGEIRPIALVIDNGPCFKSVRFAADIERRPELIHIRTRRKSPQQNGVRERAFGSLKYELQLGGCGACGHRDRPARGAKRRRCPHQLVSEGVAVTR